MLWQKIVAGVAVCVIVLILVQNLSGIFYANSSGIKDPVKGVEEHLSAPIASENVEQDHVLPTSNNMPSISPLVTMKEEPTSTTLQLPTPSPTLSPASSQSPHIVVQTPVSTILNASTAPTPQSPSKEEQATLLQIRYQGEMDALRSGCMDSVSAIVTEVTAELKKEGGLEEASLIAMQQNYLPRVLDAEASCDKQYSQLMDAAKLEYEKAGLPNSDLSVWKSQYDKTKEDARNQAIQTLMSAITIK